MHEERVYSSSAPGVKSRKKVKEEPKILREIPVSYTEVTEESSQKSHHGTALLARAQTQT